MVLDLAGLVTYQLTGSALLALAEGRTDADPLADPAVREAVRAVVAAEPTVLRAYLGPGSADSDGTLAIVPAADGQAAAASAARRVAEALAADATLRGRLVRGLDPALLPADAPAPPGEALFSR